MGRDDILTKLTAHRAHLQALGVRSLRLFGSVARDEAVPGSDVDLLVDFEQPPTYSGFMDLRIYLEDLLEAPVDLITERGLRERVRPFVEKDAIRVA
jgi:predicted nucleotidyltransferase